MSKTNHLVMPDDHMHKLYTHRNPFIRYMHRKRLRMVVDGVPKCNNLRLLDAGCGEGHLIEKLFLKNKNNKYYGIDITRIALKKARKRCPYAKLKLMDLANIKFPDKFFDVIVCTEVLEHIYEYRNVIREFKRILKKNGFLIISYPNEPLWTIARFLLRRKPAKVPDHVNSFTPEKIISCVKMDLVSQKNLPLGLPFFASLTCIMKFKKRV